MFTIRRAQLCDLTEIKELAAITVPQAFEGILTTEQIDYLEDLYYSQQALSAAFNTEQIFFIAHEGDTPVGYASVLQEGPDLFHMPKIYVLREKQHQGIGTALIDNITAHVKKVHPGPCTLELFVSNFNTSRGFYDKQGFAKVRERRVEFENGFNFIQDVLQRPL